MVAKRLQTRHLQECKYRGFLLMVQNTKTKEQKGKIGLHEKACSVPAQDCLYTLNQD